MNLLSSRKGIALFLVLSVIFVVLSTVLVGTAVLLNNLDESKTSINGSQARSAATAAWERVNALYKNDHSFFDGCGINDCIDVTNQLCVSCSSAAATYTNGPFKYSVKISDLSASGATLDITGRSGVASYQQNVFIDLSFQCGDILSDDDGYQYPTVQIGEQCWTAANLMTKRKPDGTCINGGGTPPCADASGSDDNLGRSCYDNAEARCETDGALYTWDAAMDGSSTEGARGICPTGWHVPTSAEWHTLELGLTDGENTCDPDRDRVEDCATAGTKLQLTGDSDFRGLLAGVRSGGTIFTDRGTNAHFQSSTELDASNSWRRGLSGSSDMVDRRTYGKDTAMSLRCLKD